MLAALAAAVAIAVWSQTSAFLVERGPSVKETVVVLPRDDLLEKSLSSLDEIRARRGPVIAISHAEPGDTRVADRADALIEVPRSEPSLDPLLLNLPLQLLAYHAAVALGRDVDQPRNLAKSVTVE